MDAYRYNGVKLPGLPEWDSAAWPYACIQYIPYQDGSFIAHLRCCDQPFHGAAGVITNPADAVILVHSYVSSSADFAWGTAYTVEGRALALDPDTVIWSNTDISDENGSLLLAASEPAAVQIAPILDFSLDSWLVGFAIGFSGRPLWDILFEGELTTTAHDSYNGCCAFIDGLLLSDDPGALYRVTVDGTVRVSQVPAFTEEGAGYLWDIFTLGNLHLVDARWPDSGEAFCLCTIDPAQSSFFVVTASAFLSREAGTHHVKIERIGF